MTKSQKQLEEEIKEINKAIDEIPTPKYSWKNENIMSKQMNRRRKLQSLLAQKIEDKKKMMEIIDKVYENRKDKEDEKLNEMPDEVSIKLQSGFLLGYADGVVKFREELKNSVEEI